MDPIRTQNEASSIVKNHLTEHQENSPPFTPVTKGKKEGNEKMLKASNTSKD
jgi:hypothetical protein